MTQRQIDILLKKIRLIRVRKNIKYDEIADYLGIHVANLKNGLTFLKLHYLNDCPDISHRAFENGLSFVKNHLINLEVFIQENKKHWK